MAKPPPSASSGGTAKGAGRKGAGPVVNAATPPHGATLTSNYIPRSQDTVVIAVEDLKEFRDSTKEEFWQFTFGQFLLAGSFWLGIERAVTAARWWDDPLFWICIVAFLAGGAIASFGYRQLRRRQTRIDRIIHEAEDNKRKPP